jgi:hypothetical protein
VPTPHLVTPDKRNSQMYFAPQLQGEPVCERESLT